MEHLKKYCAAVCCIDGIDTYIVSPAQCASLAADQELLERLIAKPWIKARVLHFMQTAEKFDALYLAFGHHKDRAGLRLGLEWEPVLCYKNEYTFFHVKYRDSWMCRDCGQILYAPILMPMCEGDPDFYDGTANRFPDISPLFQKVPCPKCGHLLQNHLLLLK